MKKRSRLALAVLASATVLATACGDDTKDQPHTGGARGGTGGKSTGGHAGTSAGSRTVRLGVDPTRSLHESLIEMLPDAVLALDGEHGHVAIANVAAERLLGMTRAQL